MATPKFASIRRYNGAPAMSDELVKRHDEIQAVLRPLAGFQSYDLVKTGDGVVSITICTDRAGAEESNRVAAVWLKDKLPMFAARTPEIMTGEVRMHLTPLAVVASVTPVAATASVTPSTPVAPLAPVASVEPVAAVVPQVVLAEKVTV
jgi:hypothetical protein